MCACIQALIDSAGLYPHWLAVVGGDQHPYKSDQYLQKPTSTISISTDIL